MCRWWGVYLIAVVTVFHATQAAVFRQTSYTYDRNDSKLRFIAKFGMHANAQVQLSGTFSNRTATNESVTVAFVSYKTWMELNRKLEPSNNCSQLSNLTVHRWTVPAVTTEITSTVKANGATEYWYLVFLGCVRLSPTQWEDSGPTQFDYTITIKNIPGDVLFQQFSYDMEGVGIITLIATFTYLVLVAFQTAFVMYNHWCLKHRRLHLMVKLFTLLLLLELAGQGLQLVHLGLYTSDGVGVTPLGHLGAGVAMASDCLLVLLFLLISRGWQLTKAVLSFKFVIFTIWGLYVVFSAIFFAWMVVSLVPILLVKT